MTRVVFRNKFYWPTMVLFTVVEILLVLYVAINVAVREKRFEHCKV